MEVRVNGDAITSQLDENEESGVVYYDTITIAKSNGSISVDFASGKYFLQFKSSPHPITSSPSRDLLHNIQSPLLHLVTYFLKCSPTLPHIPSHLLPCLLCSLLLHLSLFSCLPLTFLALASHPASHPTSCSTSFSTPSILPTALLQLTSPTAAPFPPPPALYVLCD